LEDPTFEKFSIQTEDEQSELACYLKADSKSQPLVLFLHGWSSNSQRMLDRMQHLSNLGYHVAAFDYRGHGDSSHTGAWTALQAAQDAISVLDSVIKQIGSDSITDLILYGHSMGGYVVCRMFHSTSKPMPIKCSKVILESSMASFPLIYNARMQGRNKLIQHMTRAALESRYRTLSAGDYEGWDQLTIPHWGVPDTPTLLLQAELDQTLGTAHHELFCKVLGPATECHILQGSDHSAHGTVAERDRLIEAFIAG
jgi:alpha-beta hydrolase superfamily lysophospholipase